MKKMVLALLCGAALLPGCAANGPAFTRLENNDPNLAMVYFYRPYDVTAFMVAPKVLVDEVEYGSLQNNGYIVCAVKPGKRIIETRGVSPGALTIYLDAEKGQEYYFRWWFEAGGNGYTMTASYRLAAIKEEFALMELQKTKKSQ